MAIPPRAPKILSEIYQLQGEKMSSSQTGRVFGRYIGTSPNIWEQSNTSQAYSNLNQKDHWLQQETTSPNFQASY